MGAIHKAEWDGRVGRSASGRRKVPPARTWRRHAREAAEYIAAMLDGLRRVANQAQLPFLSYLISVAVEEANNKKKKRD